MFDTEDLNSILIQVLVDAKKPMKLSDITDDIAYSKGDILTALKTLSNLHILKEQPMSEAQKDVTVYSLKSEITAIEVTKCSNYGIDLYSFGSFFKINSKQKKIALELASEVDKVRDISSQHRKPLVHNHKFLNQYAVDDIAKHMILIYEASNSYLLEHLIKLAEKDAVLKERLSLHEHAEKELKAYLESHNKI